MKHVKYPCVFLFVATALWGFILSGADRFFEHQFNVRRERFLRDGTLIARKVLFKEVRPPPTHRSSTSYMVGFEMTDAAEMGQSKTITWIETSRSDFDRFNVNDRLELFRIGDEYFIGSATYGGGDYQTWPFIVGVVSLICAVLLIRYWKV
jgi:hypothetical protein